MNAYRSTRRSQDASNRPPDSLIPLEAGRWSEKAASIQDERHAPTYGHLRLLACDELVHVGIQTDPDVMKEVARLLLADDLNSFRETLDKGRGQLIFR